MIGRHVGEKEITRDSQGLGLKCAQVKGEHGERHFLGKVVTKLSLEGDSKLARWRKENYVLRQGVYVSIHKAV